MPALTRHRAPINALTGARFFAASFVVVFHSRIGSALINRGFAHAGRFFLNGYLAVPLFFMLSGLILGYNYTGQIQTWSDRLQFWEARFARIWPAYLFSLVCSSFPASRIPHLPLAIATIFMVQAWNPFHPEYADAWNSVCWSLSVEAFFYLMFPLLQTRFEKLRPRWMCLVGALLAIWCVLGNAPYHNDTARYPGVFFYVIAPVIHLPVFVMGMILGNLLVRPTSLPLWKKARGTADSSLRKVLNVARARGMLTLTGVVASILTLCTARANWEGLLIPAYGLLLYGLAVERTVLSRFLSTRVLILGGEISYSVYLLRSPVHYWVSSIPVIGTSGVVSILYGPLVLIPFCTLTFYLIETPSRRALRRFFAKLKRRK